jgi:hypothetical protein
MALIDRFRRGRKSANSVNHVQRFGAVNFFSSFISRKKYSDVYYWLVISRIFRGLQNVCFDVSQEVGSDKVKTQLSDLLRFLNNNLTALVWQLWNNGFIVLETNQNGKWYLVPFDKIQTNGDGAVIKHDYVLYSEPYMFLRKTDVKLLKETLDALDVYKNSDIYLTKTFGAFGILSGSEMGINAADKEELQQQLKERAGTTEAKDQFIISNSPINFSQIDFKIKELQLPDKVKDEIKVLCAHFGVPYDLIPMSGQSTYANQTAAIVDFYRSCISPLAEQILSLARYIILKKYVTIPTTAVTFRIDNVAELADDRTAMIDYKLKVADLAKRITELNIELPEYIINELKDE